MYFDKERFKR